MRAEAIRQLKPVPFASLGDRQEAVETVIAYALGRESLPLAVQLDATPRLLQRADGESVFHRHGSELFTSQEILDAEARLVEATSSPRGAVVSRGARQAAIRRFEHTTGKTLNPGQRALVEEFVSGILASMICRCSSASRSMTTTPIASSSRRWYQELWGNLTCCGVRGGTRTHVRGTCAHSRCSCAEH